MYSYSLVRIEEVSDHWIDVGCNDSCDMNMFGVAEDKNSHPFGRVTNHTQTQI